MENLSVEKCQEAISNIQSSQSIVIALAALLVVVLNGSAFLGVMFYRQRLIIAELKRKQAKQNSSSPGSTKDIIASAGNGPNLKRDETKDQINRSGAETPPSTNAIRASTERSEQPERQNNERVRSQVGAASEKGSQDRLSRHPDAVRQEQQRERGSRDILYQGSSRGDSNSRKDLLGSQQQGGQAGSRDDISRHRTSAQPSSKRNQPTPTQQKKLSTLRPQRPDSPNNSATDVAQRSRGSQPVLSSGSSQLSLESNNEGRNYSGTSHHSSVPMPSAYSSRPKSVKPPIPQNQPTAGRGRTEDETIIMEKPAYEGQSSQQASRAQADIDATIVDGYSDEDVSKNTAKAVDPSYASYDPYPYLSNNF